MAKSRLLCFLLWQNLAFLVNGSKLCSLEYLNSSAGNHITPPTLMVSRKSISELIRINVSPEMRCALECGRSCLFYTVKEGVCRWFRHKTLDPPDMSFDTFIHTKLYVGAPCELKSFSLLIFRQDSTGGTFWPPNVSVMNVHDPTATRYAIFDEIDDWRAQDGQLHFKLCYPDLGTPCYRWRQSDNPLDVMETIPNGFVYIGPGTKPAVFGGLSRSASPNALMDACSTPGYVWYGIGCYVKVVLGGAAYDDVPGPEGAGVKRIELYLEI